MKNLLILIAVLLIQSSLTAQNGKPVKSESVLEQYCRQAAKVPPRDANAHFQFSLWCSQNQLGSHAAFYLKETLLIDEDHEGARDSLGYVRYGSTWVLKTEIAKRSGGSGSRRSSENPAETETTPEIVITKAPSPVAAEASATPESPAATGEEETEGSELTVDANKFAADVVRKKEWAASLSETLNIEFHTYEDQDFLVHTTLSTAKHPKMAQLVGHLKNSKKLISSFLGIKGKDALLWPAKVQFVLLRSEQQYQQFAEIVDQVDYAKNAEYGYTNEEHTTLWQPESSAAIRILATDAITYLNGTDRRVGWWLQDGIAEQIIGMGKMSRGKDARDKAYFYRNFKTAADVLSAENNEDNIYYLLESQEIKRRQEKRSRAMAMTLVDFLYRIRKSPRYLQALLRDLKGEEAPLAPPEDDEDALKTYWLSYVNFQEKALKTHFKKETEELDLLWKRHVIETAKKYSAAGGGEQRARYNPRGRNRSD